MNAQLVGRVRRGITETFNVRGEEVVLGREPGKGIAIAAEGVSRAHARIVWDGKNHWLEDLKSTNGTFLSIFADGGGNMNGFSFGPDGNVYVSKGSSGSILLPASAQVTSAMVPWPHAVE